MSKLVYPINYFEKYLPISKKKVKYRPFTRKEEQFLLAAAYSEKLEEKFNAVANCIRSCVEGVDVDKLPYPEVELLFINIRAKSVSEVSEFNILCGCGNPNSTKVGVDIGTIELTVPDGFKLSLVLSDDVILEMRLPNFDDIRRYNKDGLDGDYSNDLIADCITNIWIGGDCYDPLDQTREELIEFIEGIPQKDFLTIDKFFDELPEISKEVTYTCQACGKEQSYTIRGLSGFFS
jgi:hypothetical protein